MSRRPLDTDHWPVPEGLEPGRIAGIRSELLRWYAVNGRDLPWRRDVSPYRVLVSEMMLVQTTVAAVIPYFERFLTRFPDVQALAAASEDEVVKAWEGLGYYRRARQLHAAARRIVEDHGGILPPDPQAIRSLPGVGAYMAGAILSFAFDRPAPIVEANSQRVLARILALTDDLKRPSAQRQLWATAAALVPGHGAGDFNQALMDLGATICTVRTPSCLICPLKSLCKARQAGIQDQLPVLTAKPPPLEVTEATALVRHEERLLVLQRAEGGLWSRFWEFPTVHVAGADPARRAPARGTDGLASGIERLTGVQARLGPEIHALSYGVTRHRVRLGVHLARRERGRPRPGPGFLDARWVETRELGTLTLTAPARKLAAWIGEAPDRLAWPAST